MESQRKIEQGERLPSLLSLQERDVHDLMLEACIQAGLKQATPLDRLKAASIPCFRMLLQRTPDLRQASMLWNPVATNGFAESDWWSGALGNQLAGGNPFAMDHVQAGADDDGDTDQGQRVGEIAEDQITQQGRHGQFQILQRRQRG